VQRPIPGKLIRCRNGYPMRTSGMLSQLRPRFANRLGIAAPCPGVDVSSAFETKLTADFRNTQGSKFRWGLECFGVLVALINGVGSGGEKYASRGRNGSFISCYNRRRINELGSQAASAKMGHYFHRHSQGNKVKSFVPVSDCPQNGRPPTERPSGEGHLSRVDRDVVLACCGTETTRSRQKF
jgi:hypothetical protein